MARKPEKLVGAAKRAHQLSFSTTHPFTVALVKSSVIRRGVTIWHLDKL
jgi:hypothetical protein